MERYIIERTNNYVEVIILPNVEDGKYSFVNLTDEHICKCKFDSIKDAISDMDKQISIRKIISYRKI